MPKALIIIRTVTFFYSTLASALRWTTCPCFWIIGPRPITSNWNFYKEYLFDIHITIVADRFNSIVLFKYWNNQWYALDYLLLDQGNKEKHMMWGFFCMHCALLLASYYTYSFFLHTVLIFVTSLHFLYIYCSKKW